MALIILFLLLSVYLSSPLPLNTMGLNLWSASLLLVCQSGSWQKPNLPLIGSDEEILLKWLLMEVRTGWREQARTEHPVSSNRRKPSLLLGWEVEGGKAVAELGEWAPRSGTCCQSHVSMEQCSCCRKKGVSGKETPWPLLLLPSDLWRLPKSAHKGAGLCCP